LGYTGTPYNFQPEFRRERGQTIGLPDFSFPYLHLTSDFSSHTALHGLKIDIGDNIRDTHGVKRSTVAQRAIHSNAPQRGIVKKIGIRGF